MFSDQLRENPRLPMVKSLKEPKASRKPDDDPPPPPPKTTGPDGKPIGKPARPKPEP